MADIVHSDDELGKVMDTTAEAVPGASDAELKKRTEPINPPTPSGEEHPPDLTAAPSSPEAGPSNDELKENSAPLNGASPTLDGDLHSPERANVNAMREALEAQSEYEVGMPIAEKAQEIKIKDKSEDNAVKIEGQPGKQIIINIAAGHDWTLWRKVLETHGWKWNITPGQRHVSALSFLSPGGNEEIVVRPEDNHWWLVRGGKTVVEDHGLQSLNRYLWDHYKNAGTADAEPTLPNVETHNLQQPPIGGQDYEKITADEPTGMFGGTNLTNMPNMKAHHVGFWLHGKPRAAAFRSEKVAGEFVAGMEKKFAAKPMPQKGTPEWHRVQIAIRTMKMADPMVGVMGGPSKAEAQKTLAEYGLRWDDAANTVKKASKNAFKVAYQKIADYEGWTNWATWHVDLLIDNESSSYNTIRNLARNANRKGMQPEQLAEQLKRFFKKQYKATKDAYEENAADARRRRGEFEQKELRQEVPVKPGPEATREERAQYYKDMFDRMYYTMGGQSGWEEPFEEVNWIEIAERAIDNERIEQRSLDVARGEPGKLRLTPEDKKLMEEMKIKSSQKLAGDGESKTEEQVEKEAGFTFFFPGQVMREFYPEVQHELVDYPNATNAPMLTPELTGEGGHDLEDALDAALQTGSVGALLPEDAELLDVEMSKTGYESTSPAGAAGIGRDGKPEVLEGAPLRKENDIRGLMFTDEYYQNYEGVPGAAFASKQAFWGAFKQAFLDAYDGPSAETFVASKVAAKDEAEQFAMFLKKVCGEIAATMVALFKVTGRPLLDKVPGIGEVQLANVEQQTGLSPFNVVNTGSRVKYLMDKLTDSEIQDAINDAWAQGAVWHDGPRGGFVYEVFVRPETIDTDTMIMKYKFVTGTKE